MTYDDAQIIMMQLCRGEEWCHAKAPNSYVNVEVFVYVELWPDTFGIGKRGESLPLSWHQYADVTDDKFRELIRGE